METFQLSRKHLAELLLALRGDIKKSPLNVLQEAWASSHQEELDKNKALTALIGTEMPSIFQKLIKVDRKKVGFSINEIVALGNQIEYTHLSSSAVQNWVKRDVKALIGSPQLGKKYTLEQSTILFIVEDLKSSLDFHSISKILTMIFRNPADRSDDIIDPIILYNGYAAIFEKIHHTIIKINDGNHPLNNQIENFIKAESEKFIQNLTMLSSEDQKVVLNTLIITCLSVQTTYYQSTTNRHLNAALFSYGI
ncbi:DUF1836 domain-containing protein [Pseudalkalibacillus caeni]|uniref:DUF1836 domain-containing protein n=1 Tax=Exobacillus caeni TaxID=2574798 RepID=A0A5R9F0T0_9BACL|nr:DUF1836 domain-containing protein [Pseudalkalibacillus caeni]TLS37157.1 DUF1836 domain-containing protein [Pseudalkalibacillus caeni]